MSITFSLSQELQSNSVDLAKASDLVTATTETLQVYRQEESWQELFQYAVQVAEGIDICTDEPYTRQRKAPKRLSDSVVYETSGHKPRESTHLIGIRVTYIIQ